MFDGNELRGSKITVLGAGLSGVSIARLARRLGAGVFVSDSSKISDAAVDSLNSNGIRFEQGGHTDRVLDANTIVLGSGFPPHAPILEKLASQGIRPIGELDFVMPYIKGRVVGITGSNGKTTTTSLIGHLINAAGKRCAVAGNIGSPIADFAGEDCEYVSLELSSFQLHWANSARLAGAVVTNLAPDHIDWHGSYENYAAAKARILDFIGTDGFGIVQKRDVVTLKADRAYIRSLSWDEGGQPGGISLSARGKTARMDDAELFSFGETKLLGAHNMENIAMAMAAVRLLGFGIAPARASLSSYEAPPHRCRLVLERGGVRYIDDSKGTNIAASSTAMSSIEGPHIVILGGRGKGEDYSNLIEPLKKYAKRALLIGEAAGEIAAAFGRRGYSDYRDAGNLENAVRIAAGEAVAGDCVLLSPACTSWDAYNNYHERGEHFASLVMKYAGEAL
ncbi:MAG: UDP-N-acetylmuramoyl-L-alanine--D-glutamate ligase [Synergistaceae bacterium]|jgi:UDP-N-acetylmuramoylalanine--D-glutamate ligase|nr:UDP-N-acetylmuramoyl-L-alanine--D-glutamate ligase [Synergistaceae bacterium]